MKARVIAVNFADDELNPVEVKTAEREIARVKTAKLIVLPAGPDSKGHQNLQRAALWKQYVSELLGRRRRVSGAVARWG